MIRRKWRTFLHEGEKGFPPPTPNQTASTRRLIPEESEP